MAPLSCSPSPTFPSAHPAMTMGTEAFIAVAERRLPPPPPACFQDAPTCQNRPTGDAATATAAPSEAHHCQHRHHHHHHHHDEEWQVRRVASSPRLGATTPAAPVRVGVFPSSRDDATTGCPCRALYIHPHLGPHLFSQWVGLPATRTPCSAPSSSRLEGAATPWRQHPPDVIMVGWQGTKTDKKKNTKKWCTALTPPPI